MQHKNGKDYQSNFITFPAFITKDTFSILFIFFKGLPSTAIISATFPTSIDPNIESIPSNLAVVIVAKLVLGPKEFPVAIKKIGS